jgi:hypothetical protein
LAGAIGDRRDIKKQRVVGTTRAGILDGNSAVNAVPLADEDQADAFLDQGGAVFTDQDRVLKVSDPPALGKQRKRSEPQSKTVPGIWIARLSPQAAKRRQNGAHGTRRR